MAIPQTGEAFHRPLRAAPADASEGGRFRKSLRQRRHWTLWSGLLLLAAALAILFTVLRFLIERSVGTPDFLNFYAAGAILKSGAGRNLYNFSLQQQIQSGFAPYDQFGPYIHPPFYAYLFAPLAYFSFADAYLLWSCVNLCVLALIFYLLPRTGRRLSTHSRLVWLVVCLPLAGDVIVLGQDSLLLTLVFLAAYLELKRRHEFAAGLLLGLGMFRFEIILPFLFIFLLRGRWKTLAGSFAVSLATVAASAAVVGWKGLIGYGRVLLGFGHVGGGHGTFVIAALMPSLRGAAAASLGGILPPRALFAIVLAGTLLLLGWSAWQFRNIDSPERPAFDLEFSLAVLAALLASYHLFIDELAPLIIAGFLMLGFEDAMNPGESPLSRPGTLLLLLLSLVAIVGEVLIFRGFTVEFIVVLGMVVWLSQEILFLREPAPSG